MKRTLTFCATIGALTLGCPFAWAINEPPGEGNGTPPCEAAVVNVPPASQGQCPTGTATFSVIAAGTAPLTYQWRKDGNDLSNGGNISGATTERLTISNLTTGNAGNYWVNIHNDCGNVNSASAYLTVANPSTPPVITRPPVSQTLCEHSSTTLWVEASGIGLRYKWRKDGVDLIGFEDMGSSLSLNNVTSSDAGDYTVVVTDCGSGSVTSSAATIAVVYCDRDGDGLPDPLDPDPDTRDTTPPTFAITTPDAGSVY